MKRFLTVHLLRSMLVMLGLIFFSAASFAQKQVSGKVIDESGMTLPGVNVVEKGSTNGTITDIDGVYHLTVKENATLEFSYMGFDTQEVSAANGTTFNVTLKENTKEIDEVVVVGYGTMKKSDMSGSSITVGAGDIEGFVGSGIDGALQGKAAGVQVTANSGQPGGGMSVSIRGNSTLSLKNSQPLYVVDGVPIQNVSQSGADVGLGDAMGNGNGTFSGLSNLNPEDIESMEILKDASATAIYGSRAANGVVLITTKKGKKGKANFNYVGTYGVSQQATRLDLMNLRDFATYASDWYSETQSKQSQRSEYYDPSILGAGEDWQDQIYRTAQMQTHQISAAGGTDNVRYYISAGYYDQEGTMLGTDYKRYSTRVNLDADLTSFLKVGTNFSFANSEDNLGLTNSEDGILSQAYRMLPDVPCYTMDGKYSADNREGASPKANPVWTALSMENKLKRFDLTNNLFAEIKFLKNLTFRSEYSTNNLWSKAYHYEPKANYDGYKKDQNEIRHQSNQNLYWEVKNYLTYTDQFADKHNITAMFGQETSEFKWEYMAGSAVNLESDGIHEPYMGKDQTIGSGHGSGSRVSMFGRFFYNYDGKYNLTYTFRRDASSNFGPENRWGNFHSVSLSWNAHKEEFLASLLESAKISTARLRLGWGQVGNDNIGAFKWGASGSSDVNGLGSTYQITNIPNTSVSWETQESFNLGLDLSFMKDRFNLIFEAYTKTSKDMLMTMELPTYMGTSIALNGSQRIDAPSGNFGEIKNKGIELTLSTTNINKKGFKWTTDFQFSKNTNELVSLSGSGNSEFYGYGQWTDVVSITREGSALYQFFGYKVVGVYQNLEDLLSSPKQQGCKIGRDGYWIGDYKYEDLNKDGVINAQDRQIIGNPFPKFTAGLTNTLTYKGFELGIFLTASYGNDVLNYNSIALTAMKDVWTNQLADVKDHTVLAPIDANYDYNHEYDWEYEVEKEDGTKETKIDHYKGIHRQVKFIQGVDENGDPKEIVQDIHGIQNWFDDPENVVVANPGSDLPRAVAGDPAQNTRISNRYIEDGSFIKIKSISLAYNIPSVYTRKLKMDAVKVYASVSNLYTFTKYKGMDPEVGTSATSDYVLGLDNGRYPAPRIVTFGVNISF